MDHEEHLNLLLSAESIFLWRVGEGQAGGRSEAGRQEDRKKRPGRLGEDWFWRGALRGRSPCTREAACGRPPNCSGRWLVLCFRCLVVIGGAGGL